MKLGVIFVLQYCYSDENSQIHHENNTSYEIKMHA
jgi:hypothetical protein